VFFIAGKGLPWSTMSESVSILHLIIKIVLVLSCSEELVLTTGTHHNEDWNPVSHGCDPTLPTELSPYPICHHDFDNDN